ncbi:MAG: glycosyltransferase, partial [Bacteroidales bacterium]|nr:glycosyltransferase [Bacteroidales bacterium]
NVEKEFGYKFEIILVNDCSPDTTIDCIKRLAEKYSNVKGIDMLYNVGQEMALMCGFENCTGDYIVTMDDDLQHSPKDIKLLYDYMLENPDMEVCIGYDQDKKHSKFRNLGSSFVSFIMSYIFKKPKGLVLTSYRIMKKVIVECMVEHKTMYPLVDPMIVKTTRKVTNINLEHLPRKYGESNYNLFKLVRLTLNHIFNFSTLPLKMISVVGFVVALLALIASIIYLTQYALGLITLPGWITNVLLINFFGGAILFTLGIMGQYIIRIMYETKGFPRFKIKQVYSAKN